MKIPRFARNDISGVVTGIGGKTPQRFSSDPYHKKYNCHSE